MLAVSASSTVRVAALDGLAELVQQTGHSFEALLRRAQIGQEALSEPDNRLPLKQFVELLDAAAAVTGDDSLGLHLGARQSLHMAGVLGYGLESAATVGDQLAHAARYFALHQDGAEVDLHVDGETAVLRYTVVDPTVLLHRHDAEATIAICVNHWRAQTGTPDWSPLSAHFEHAEPGGNALRTLRRFMGCPVSYGERFNGLVFPTTFLGTQICSADPQLHRILARYADDALSSMPQMHSWVGRTRRQVIARLAHGEASVDVVARQLATTTRTLQRRLGDEGVHFAEVVDDARRELASRYLRDSRLTLTDTAFLLGYSDLTAFHRAFRRWYQQTPAEYQRACKAAPSSEDP